MGEVHDEVHAIINPAAGNGRTGRRWPRLREQVRRLGLRVHEHRTTASGHAIEIARRLAGDRVREVVVVGGDGTLNEVVNGLFLGTSDGNPSTVVSLIPCGTGRDFSRTLGIWSTEEAVALLANGGPCAIDVGKVRYQANGRTHERVFMNIADVGLGAETAARMNRSSKALGGFLTYMIGAICSVMVFKSRPARVVVDGETVHDGPVGMVVLANGRYHAGGMLLAPDASVMDGQLEVIILLDVSKLTLLGSLLPRVYRGRHIGHPAVRAYRGREVTVHSPDRLPLEMDGEQPGTTDLHATVIPRAIRFRALLCDKIAPEQVKPGDV